MKPASAKTTSIKSVLPNPTAEDLKDLGIATIGHPPEATGHPMNDQELNQLHSAASAIAAFQLSQFCFSALVQNGIVPRPDAERLLRQAVQTNKTGGPGNQAAADLLAIFLDQVPMFQPPTRQ
jgi:hypothetical protein